MGSPVADKTKKPPSTGPIIQPMPLALWARLIRAAPDSGGPRTVVYGLQTVSRQVKPVARMNKPSRNDQYVLRALTCVAGMNQKDPSATRIRPMMIAPL